MSISPSPLSSPALVTFAALACLLGCSPTSNGEGPQDPTDVTAPVPEASVKPITVVGYTGSELLSELEGARALLLVDKWAEAAKAFDHLRRLAVKSPEIAALALFNSGVAHEGLGRREVALERYRELSREHPTDPVTKNGLIRMTRLLGYLERWDELGQTADLLIARQKSLPAMDKIEAFGAKALSLVELGQVEPAQKWVTRARDIIEEKRFGRAGTPPMQLAQVSFALGEIRRLRSEEIKLTPVTGDFPAVLERRCQGLLDAQDAYTDAMRSRDAHWSAMSGYRVGQLYQQLHREAMAIPPPESARTLKQKQLFEGAMRLRYRILLEKGLKLMASIVRLGERTGESSFWVARARAAQGDLERALADEKTALGKLPYTEDELRAALEKLKGK